MDYPEFNTAATEAAITRNGVLFFSHINWSIGIIWWDENDWYHYRFLKWTL